MTITFEMKSGREHSTPDRAMWGVALTVRPQESAEEHSTALHFITDLYLSLASVCCSLIGQLYAGPTVSAEEEKCSQLMDSELLQCCVWPVDEGPPDVLPLEPGNFPTLTPSPHSPLPAVVMRHLRGLAEKPAPTLRPSSRALLQPELLEELIVCVCLKHHGLQSVLELLGKDPGSCEMKKYKSLLDAIFTR